MIDFFIMIISVIDLIALDSVDLQFFQSLKIIKIFKVFRTFRILKLIKFLSFINVILDVFERSYHKIITMGFLLSIFVLIYSLFGYQIFAGKFENLPDYSFSYDSLFQSFLTVFQIMTLENWNSILYNTMRTDVNQIISLTFLITWIILGNLLFLNLFLSIILDAFTHNDNGGNKEEEKKLENYGSIFSINEIPQKAEMMKSNEILKFCEKSLFLFPRFNIFRKICFRITRNNFFEWIILLLIFISSFKLCFDTYLSSNENYLYFSDYLDLAMNIAFAIEFFLKIVAFGFHGNNSYLDDSWNKLDFCLVIISLIDIMLTDVDLSIMKIFRLLRIFRPLRLLTRNQNMRLIVNAMFMSFEAIFDVLLVVFAIL